MHSVGNRHLTAFRWSLDCNPCSVRRGRDVRDPTANWRMMTRSAHHILRTTAAIVLAGVVGISTTACGEGVNAKGDAGSVTFVAYGGTGQEAETRAWFEPFEKETGVTVVQDNPTSWVKVEEMVKAK